MVRASERVHVTILTRLCDSVMAFELERTRVCSQGAFVCLVRIVGSAASTDRGADANVYRYTDQNNHTLFDKDGRVQQFRCCSSPTFRGYRYGFVRTMLLMHRSRDSHNG
jgi:hypothetical protein